MQEGHTFKDTGEFVDFVSWYDSDEQRKDMFVKVLEVAKNYLKFKTTMGNEVVIPWSRVLKVKIKGVVKKPDSTYEGGF